MKHTLFTLFLLLIFSLPVRAETTLCTELHSGLSQTANALMIEEHYDPIPLYTGPGKAYAYLGQHYSSDGVLQCISLAADTDGTLWSMVDFSDGYLYWRGYTPLSSIPADQTQLVCEANLSQHQYIYIASSTPASSGPGYHTSYDFTVGSSDYANCGHLIMIEDEAALIDLEGATPAMRVWVPLSAVSGFTPEADSTSLPAAVLFDGFDGVGPALTWGTQGTAANSLDVYTGPGEEFLHAGVWTPTDGILRCFSQAVDSYDQYWVLVDFQDTHCRRRGYVRLSSISVDTSMLFVEHDIANMSLMEACTFEETTAFTGPGPEYAQSAIRVNIDGNHTTGILIMLEDTWAMVDVTSPDGRYRLWVPEESIFY